MAESMPDRFLKHLSDRFSEPLHISIMALVVRVLGSTRAKVAFDAFSRRAYAFGILAAADKAKATGVERIAAIEFGVANGVGLFAMSKLASRIEKVTGVKIDVIGFDTGRGMPNPRDYRDHPENYRKGYWSMRNPEELEKLLPSNSRLILGDISETVEPFLDAYQGTIGFVAIDVDHYSSTTACLKLFTGPPTRYLPLTPVFLDDVAGDIHNAWCGELLAVREFNDRNALRKITPWNFLRQQRILKNAIWIDQMHTLHVLDHPVRQGLVELKRSPESLSLEARLPASQYRGR